MSKQGSIKYLLRKRIKIFAVVVVILSCVFICYQLFYFKQLNEQLQIIPSPVNLIRGIHPQHAIYYTPKDSNKFTCIHSKEVIDFSQVNDDYCDCLDGSDEPGTNACTNGIFFCLYQDSTEKYRKVIPSTMVNDGICDCCDGSDEWGAEQLPFRLELFLDEAALSYFYICFRFVTTEARALPDSMYKSLF